MNEGLSTAQSAAVMELLNWISKMDVEGLGKYEYEENESIPDRAILFLSTEAADAFQFEPNPVKPYIHVPSAYEDLFSFAPWTKAELVDGNTLHVNAGPPGDENSTICIVFPVSAEAAENIKSARFICFASPIDDKNERYERPVMLVKNTDE